MGNVYKRPLTLLERWERYGMAADGFKAGVVGVSDDEIRRALAIAQAVEEKPSPRYWHANDWREWIMRRADELLEGKK